MTGQRESMRSKKQIKTNNDTVSISSTLSSVAFFYFKLDKNNDSYTIWVINFYCVLLLKFNFYESFFCKKTRRSFDAAY